MTTSIAIIDLGGQYCHLISRRLRDLGIWSDILDPSTLPENLSHYAGIILSGGPNSVYDADSPTVDPRMFELGIPVLGICYGHQLLAKYLGAVVAPASGEYGFSKLSLLETDSLFIETPNLQTVWMSHSDSVTALPPSITRLAKTERCDTAAFADFTRRLYGIQFHPEVVHTEYGMHILKNFSIAICGVEASTNRQSCIPQLIKSIRKKVRGDSVFFLISGGVDSTVAFTLCAKALPRERILGMYVDTGLMRKDETEELRTLLKALDLSDRLIVRNEVHRFLEGLEGVVDPEKKRQIIGRLFVEVQAEAMREYGIEEDHWLLGQGTIYPDTIESGGTSGRAALIKTHHNRCDEIRHLLEQGRVVEPLAEFYKDEVRQLGIELGLDSKFVNRWPFPGPGLAIRCLCSDIDKPAGVTPLVVPPAYSHYQAVELPIQSVGVQGDGRTYREVVALRGPLEYDTLEKLSTDLCNIDVAYNRVIIQVSDAVDSLRNAFIKPVTLCRERLEILRGADFITRTMMREAGLTNTVWQFPVVLIPMSFHGGESVVLRPINSKDGMTANFSRLPIDVLKRISDRIMSLEGIDAVFLDVTNKPPATIEWE